MMHCSKLQHFILAVALLAVWPRGASADDFSGVWAARLTLPVTWENKFIPRVTGSIQMTGWVERTSQGLGVYEERFTPCSLSMPTFHTLATRHNGTQGHGIIVPDALFDEGFFPPSLAYQLRESAPGSYALNSQTIALVAGGRLANPQTDPWSLLTAVDGDKDGNAGISVLPDTRGGLTPLGLNLWATWKAHSIWVAMRLRFQMQVRAVGNAAMEGLVQPLGDGMDKTVWGGQAMNSERQRPFTDTEKKLLENLFEPRWDRSRPGSIVLQRLPNRPACSDIRSRFHAVY